MKQLLTLVMLLIVGAVGVRTQGPTSTNGQPNGFAWVQMSNASKLMYVDGVEAGFTEGWLAGACQRPQPQYINREGVMRDINEFYAVSANLSTPIASAYAQTRRNLRDDLGKP